MITFGFAVLKPGLVAIYNLSLGARAKFGGDFTLSKPLICEKRRVLKSKIRSIRSQTVRNYWGFYMIRGRLRTLGARRDYPLVGV